MVAHIKDSNLAPLEDQHILWIRCFGKFTTGEWLELWQVAGYWIVAKFRQTAKNVLIGTPLLAEVVPHTGGEGW